VPCRRQRRRCRLPVPSPVLTLSIPSQLCPVELPGRNTRLREPRPTAMAPLVAALADALGPLTSSAPFALYGHSLGAWIAYELAQELASRGTPPPLALFASGVRAPSLAGAAHDPDGVEIHLLKNSSEFWAAMERRYGHNPELQDPAVRRFIEPQLKADFQVSETYRPAPGRPPLACPLYVLGGDRDPRYKREQLEAWRGVAGPFGFEARVFRGGHMFLFRAEESAREVGEYVNERLRGVMAAENGAAVVAAEMAPASPVAASQAPGSVRSADSEAGATVGSGSSAALAFGYGAHGMERHGDGGGSEMEELGTPTAQGKGGVFNCCW
jgi:medium-chain acyl-[acyl-carrier-protein] hydrolase